MASKYEELRISVVLDDRALAQLQRINREVAQIGGGPNNLPRALHKVPPLRAFAVGA
jgi:hypothetical protein